jgi:hypothetical protein
VQHCARTTRQACTDRPSKQASKEHTFGVEDGLLLGLQGRQALWEGARVAPYILDLPGAQQLRHRCQLLLLQLRDRLRLKVVRVLVH